jgi:uncharacterized protein YunC (DUF1805 family)
LAAVLMHLNDHAHKVGWSPGTPVAEALAGQVDTSDQVNPTRQLADQEELIFVRAYGIPLCIADSVSLVTTADRDTVVITGSHGGLPGGDAKRALKALPRAAFFNDAGGGLDGAGYLRLDALDDFGVAGATVSSTSARIGDAMSTLNDGIVSRCNRTARLLGIEIGTQVRDVLRVMSLSINANRDKM